MPPTLETRRLQLRLPREDDLDNIYALGSSPRVMRFITLGRTQSRAEAEEDLQKRMATNGDPLGYWITERRDTGEFLGWMALKSLDNTPDIEIGYRFLESAWGKGYATEGGAKILDYAFLTLQIPEVVAVAIPENRASIRVMEKLGMRYLSDGQFYGVRCVRYGVSQQAWLEKRLP